MFGIKFGFRGPFMMEEIPHAISNQILPLKCGFGIGYGIGRKYNPIWVSVSVSDLNQNSGFGRTLICTESVLVQLGLSCGKNLKLFFGSLVQYPTNVI